MIKSCMNKVSHESPQSCRNVDSGVFWTDLDFTLELVFITALRLCLRLHYLTQGNISDDWEMQGWSWEGWVRTLKRIFAFWFFCFGFDPDSDSTLFRLNNAVMTAAVRGMQSVSGQTPELKGIQDKKTIILKYRIKLVVFLWDQKSSPSIWMCSSWCSQENCSDTWAMYDAIRIFSGLCVGSVHTHIDTLTHAHSHTYTLSHTH